MTDGWHVVANLANKFGTAWMIASMSSAADSSAFTCTPQQQQQRRQQRTGDLVLK
jgi:hypothetical protein